MDREPPYRNADDTWTSDALERGDVAAVMSRVRDDPAYLTSRDFIGNSPLRNAVAFSLVDLVDFLIRHGADPDEAVDDGYTCLLTAVESDDPASAAVVARLIAAGADVHRTGTNGWTPLHMAAAWGRVEKARLLIDAGADVNRRTEIDAGETPLMEAAHGGHPETVRLLLERGADPTLRDMIHDRTPAQIAEYVAKGADPAVLEFLKTVDFSVGHEPLLEGVDLPPDRLETLRVELKNLDMVEAYREAADRTARDGDHAGVIRVLNEFKGR